MTRLEYDWWALNADKDDPEVIEIMSRTEPHGYTEPELNELRGRTERAFIGGLLIAGVVPASLRSLDLKPKHFLLPPLAAAWTEIQKHEDFDRLEIERGLAEAGKMSFLAAGTILASTLDNAACATDLSKYGKRIIEGWGRARTARP